MIHVTENGNIATVRMEHGKVQAMDLELIEALTAAFQQLSGAGAVVLTGTGSSFSAGVDLPRLLREGADYTSRFVQALVDGLRQLFAFPRPVIAAINGHAIAGGCILACVCDHRIMSTGKGRTGVPELQVGVAFPPIVIEILRACLPAEHLQEIAYLGLTYDVDQSLRLGLIDEAVEPDALMARASDVASRLAAVPRLAFESAKAQLRAPSLERADRGQTDFGAAILRQWQAPETAEVIRAYLERTLHQKQKTM